VNVQVTRTTSTDVGARPESLEPSVSCASTNTIAALLAGAADSAAAERLEVHLDQCPACRRLVAELGRGLSAIEHTAPRDGLPQIGEAIGRYQLQRVVGVGGMGVVYRAHDTTLDREVAIKLLRPDLLEGPSLLAEAQAMARLQHPNIVTVHDAGIANNQLYICMEYVAGTTLRTATQNRGWREIVEMYRAAGEGLAYVHRAGLVHLDFKPDNVLVDGDGRVRVTDFGLARMMGRPDKRIVGTPAYMAPEQRTGGRVDARTDQFAFCTSLREALGDNWRLRRVLARGLEPRPTDRYPDMEALLAAITRATRRKRAPAAFAIVAAAIAAAIFLPQSPRVVTTTVDRPRTIYRDRYQPATTSSSSTITALAQESPTVSTAPPVRVQAASADLEMRRARKFHIEHIGYAATLFTSAATTTTPSTESDDPGDIDDAGTLCDDGSLVTCNLWPPSCPAGSLLAVQDGCWTCAEALSCMSLGFPRTCNDGTPLRCSQEAPTCPGRTIAAIRSGCWSCQDPFTCGSRALKPVYPPPRKPPGRPPPSGSGSNTGGSNTGSNTGSNGGNAVCGNGFCEIGEDHTACAGDCCETDSSGACLAQCGNGFCENGENHASCANDCCETTGSGACAPVCGNGFCEDGETCPGECP
jgi:serine/threonine protein kinase